jgi:hypothetical protein
MVMDWLTEDQANVYVSNMKSNKLGQSYSVFSNYEQGIYVNIIMKIKNSTSELKETR